MRLIVIVSLTLISLSFTSPVRADTASSWSAAKNAADDRVYFDRRVTLYCGCTFVSDGDSDGSGDVDPDACGLTPLPKQQKTAKWIEWEHIVPASLTPARDFACWEQPKRFKSCIDKDGESIGGRQCCERVSSSAQAMLFDLHNLAPSVGQLNRYRSSDRYGEVAEDFDSWPGCEARDQHGTQPDREGLAKFEPPDCVKGDVARVWFYMHEAHGVRIDADEYEMFLAWDKADPVSPWEQKRDHRISTIQGNNNPYVVHAKPSIRGFCEWEQQ